jgi:hypothetical protein
LFGLINDINQRDAADGEDFEEWDRELAMNPLPDTSIDRHDRLHAEEHMFEYVRIDTNERAFHTAKIRVSTFFCNSFRIFSFCRYWCITRLSIFDFNFFSFFVCELHPLTNPIHIQEVENPWDKGDASGAVYYTDALYWDKQRGEFDEVLADSW